MCGIFGLQMASNVKIDEKLIKQSMSLLKHRGPDGQGFIKTDNIAFAHTRLSFLDISERSNQPFWDESRRYCLIYNGEIYNYQQLKENLIKQGVSFKTTSDTEALLYTLIHKGVNALKELEGMFAFAFYDTKTKKMILARDRFGIKPLYLCKTSNGLLFSSEVTAFSPWTKLTPDLFSISGYLLGSGGNTQSKSFYNDIHELEAGTYAIVTNGGITKAETFFHLTNFLDHDYSDYLSKRKVSLLIDDMDELLSDSVQKHMISDVPVGALCSGGVDSSILLAMAHKLNSNIQIFHSNVMGPHSELHAAEALARHLDLDLKVVNVSDDDFIKNIPEVMQNYGMPFIYHPNSIPFLMVTQLVQQHKVKAILTGEGADESYLGYSHIPTENFFKSIHKFTQRASSLIKNIPLFGDKLIPTDNNLSMAAKYIYGDFETTHEDEIISNVTKGFHKHSSKSLHYLGYHLRTLLHRNDTMGMSASIEARFPFLDNDLIKFAVNLPYKYKIKKTIHAYKELKHPFIRSKWILRQIADRYLPKELSQRTKRGFPTNAFERMNINNDYFSNSYIADLFSLPKNRLKNLLDSSPTEQKLRLLQLNVWGEIYFNGANTNDLSMQLSNNVTVKPLSPKINQH
ncbi:Asparagine synthetase [glutamine-hydrolyzing] [hydrothermal vent metagenome]|uniref:Asparagine synthetase [glutamine-hydrolyzing] n=1 Tax=hydrothermal vent metagenome TaxID=652676 RepID=A0A3B1A3J9_9ZZZZ